MLINEFFLVGKKEEDILKKDENLFSNLSFFRFYLDRIPIPNNNIVVNMVTLNDELAIEDSEFNV